MTYVRVRFRPPQEKDFPHRNLLQRAGNTPQELLFGAPVPPEVASARFNLHLEDECSGERAALAVLYRFTEETACCLLWRCSTDPHITMWSTVIT
jgi:hypothetical protein